MGIRKGASLLFLLMLFPVNIFCSEGGLAGSIFSFGVGGRALGLGKAYVGVSEDASAIYWNPAASAQIRQTELLASHAFLWEGTIYDYASFAVSFGTRGVVGVGGVMLYSGGAEKRSLENTMTGTFSFFQLGSILSYGRRVRDNLSVGGSMKYLITSLDVQRISNLMFDVGVFYQPVYELKLGCNIQNLLSVKLSGETEDVIPVVIRLGAGYRLFKERLLLAFDLERRKNTFAYHIGLESKITNMIRLRIGQDSEEFTGGIGVNIKNISIDYSFSTEVLGLWGLTHRISLLYKFGKSQQQADLILPEIHVVIPEEQLKKEFEMRYQDGIEKYRKGRYAEALAKFSEAKAIFPEDAEVKSIVAKLKIITSVISEMTGNDKIAEYVRKGLEYYMNDRNEYAVLFLTYAYSLDKKNYSLERLLRKIEKDTGYSIELLPGFTNLVEQKLYESDTLLRTKRDTDGAIRACEAVILLEPTSKQAAEAYKRMGTAYFSLGMTSKAVEAWENSIKIVPDNDLKEYIEKFKREMR
jgi:tetratricopeptide (TPR) repeat protein